MNPTERQLAIRGMLEQSEFVSIEELVGQLGASSSTVLGALRRVRGGALSLSAREPQADPAEGGISMAREKRRIARAAAGLIEDGQTVILDGGSTVAFVAQQLEMRHLHVITNSLPIAEILKSADGIELTLTGGFLYRRLGVLLGPLCEQMLRSVAADIVIMGIGGVSQEGFGNNNTLVVGSEQAMIEVSRKVVIVTDHTKFGRAAMLPVAPLGAADIVVTDSGLEPSYAELLGEAGVEVRQA
jgi:DeoR family fructose operon transcriptional repressor